MLCGFTASKEENENTKTKFGMLIASVALAASGAVCAADAPVILMFRQPAKALMTNFGCASAPAIGLLLWQKPGRLLARTASATQTLLSAKPAQKELLFLPTHSSPSTKPF